MPVTTKNEIISVLIATLVIAFSANLLLKGIIPFLWVLLSVFVVIFVNILAKKLTGFYLETETESKFWEINWFGFKEHHHFKKPFPLGAFLPIISKVILFPLNGFVWMASLVFEVKPKTYRSARRHGLYTFSGMTESHMAYIAAAGIGANILFGIIGYLLGYGEFARLNIYYALFNMFPLSSLDGNKIFFGNLALWSFLSAVVLIGLFLTLFIV